MKTNSTFKFLQNLLLLVVGVLGFAVSGVGQISWDIEPINWNNVTKVDGDYTGVCGEKYQIEIRYGGDQNNLSGFLIVKSDGKKYPSNNSFNNDYIGQLCWGSCFYSVDLKNGDSKYIIIEGNESVGYSVSLNDSPATCGATVTDASIDAEGFCVEKKLSVSSDATGTATYAWKKIGSNDDLGTNEDYTPSSSGDYYVLVTVGSTTVSSDTVTIYDSPTLIVSPTSLSFETEPTVAQVDTITVTTACSDHLSHSFSGSTDFTVVALTGDDAGKYKVTYNKSTLGNSSATLIFTADDVAPVSVSLTGSAVTCASHSLSVGATTFDLVSTSVSNNIPSGSKDVSVSGIDPTASYKISFDITGYNGQLGWGNYTINASVDGKNVYNHTFAQNASFSSLTGGFAVVSGSAISSNVTINFNAGLNNTTTTLPVENFSVTKVCPPEVEISSWSSECDASASFTATATKGTGNIASYTWYINNVQQGSAITSSSLSNTWNPGSAIANGSVVKVVVTDENGLSADFTRTINCGPDIDDISTPAEICPNGNLSLSIPTVTVKEGTTVADADKGWEVADSPTSDSWTPLASLNGLSVDYKNKYIRYYAIDNQRKKGKSNAVQITMFDAPEVGTISVDDICKDGTFSLTTPSVTYDAAASSTAWQYSTSSGFATATNFTGSTPFGTAGTYYIRYKVTDACTIVYSNTETVNVNVPSITPSYTTYTRAAGSTGAVVGAATTTSTCVGALTYSIVSGNDNNYFAINSSTGEITLTSAATVAGTYSPITVRVTDGSLTRDVNISVTLTETPTLTVTGCMPSEIWAYTNQPITNVYRVASNYINGDVELSLSGNAASYFSLSQNPVEKNTAQDVTLNLASPFTLGGNRTLTFTAHDSENDGVADVVCTTTIHVVNITFTDYVADQVSCSSEANTLRVAVGDNQEDATHLPLSYQWYKDDVAIDGATSATYMPTKTGSGAGQYHCVVSTGGNVVHTTTKANISFTEGVPVLSFNDTPAIPEEVFCSQEVGAVMKVTFNGNDVTNDYDRFWWINTKSKNKEGITENGEHTFSFSCSGTPTDATIGAYIRDNASGCTIYATKSIHVKEMGNTYYYCGPTGSSSALNVASNWCTSPTGTPGSCTSPSNFTTDACEYIINSGTYAEPVELLSGQDWTVGGVGSKITIGNDKWEDLNGTPDVNCDITRVINQYSSYKQCWGKNVNIKDNADNGKGYKLAINNGAYMKENTPEILGNGANIDLRSWAQSVKISGELTLNNGVNIDITSGSHLEIATNQGNPTIGTCAKDEVVTRTNNGELDVSNMWYKPGSSVTYSGTGAEKIRSGDYSHLYINATEGAIAFDNNALITVSQSLKDVTATAVAFENIDPNESTIMYVGGVNQEVASLKYYNLQTESASDKTLVGDIEVTNKLTIGAGSVLAAADNDITVSGSGNAVSMLGKFDCGTSTFNYVSEDETTVESMNYYNLNLGSDSRTFSNKNIIGIAGEFTPGTGTRTVAGSTVEFNGSTPQSIPEFTFYDLVLNNTAMRLNSPSANTFNSEYYITQTGRVEVQHNLLLTEGILDTDDKVLIVSNPAASAVSQGRHDGTSVREAAYINGEITRVLPENLNGSSATMYYFPVGDDDGYKPLAMNYVNTTENPIVTVGIEYNGLSGRLEEDGAEVNTGFAWHVDGNAGYTDASVGVSMSTSKVWHDEVNNIDITPNALAYGETASGTFVDVYGSVDAGGNILFSVPKGEGYYALLYRVITNKTYYYDCTGGTGDITNISSWHTERNGGGSPASAFNESDAKWIIECGAEINGDLTINGPNSVVEMYIPSGQQLSVKGDVEFITAVIKKGTVSVGTDGVFTVDYGFKMEDVTQNGINEKSNRSSLINNGRVNLYLADVVLTNSYIENNGLFHTEDVDFDLSSPGNKKDPDKLAGMLLDGTDVRHTQFINTSRVEMTNANFYATGYENANHTGEIDCGSRLHIRNASNAVWLIDNTSKAGASFVEFFAVEFAGPEYGYNVAFVDFQCNSTFAVKHADVTMRYKGSSFDVADMTDPAFLGGSILVEDGNLQLGRSSQGGGDFNINQTCGSIYLNDTDNSGDGLLECVGGGGYHVNVAGTVYAMGITVADGASGCDFTVEDGGTVFIGNIGAVVPGFSWVFTIKVDAGGTLFYCGNRTASADGIGTNEGTLYYAGNYYFQSDPVSEEDFINNSPGVYEQMYASEEQCMNAYRQHLPSFLPVEMTVLYGICVDDNKVELRWQTASETNNSYFVILRSFDGVHFEEIGTVAGAGTTTEMHNYEYYDTDDNNGIVYYKLRQVDYDGNYTDSKVIAVQTCGKNARFSIGSEEIEVFFRNPQANYVVITSVTGQIFYSKKFTNVEEARIAVPQRKGIYIISVIDSKQITSEKFIR